MQQKLPLRETFFSCFFIVCGCSGGNKGFKPLAFHFVMFEQGLRQVRRCTVPHKPNKGIHDEKIT